MTTGVAAAQTSGANAEKTVKGSGEHRKVAFASFVGTTIEWYDYYLYGTCAALIFPHQFFPELDAWVGTIAAFATYAVGFIARPAGAAVFGHMGDRIGRKKVLVISLWIMGASTVAIGLLPTYDSIGAWAALLLTVLRMTQGFAIGGEWGSAVVMAVEHAPRNRRGLYGCTPQIGVPAGLLLSTLAFWAVSYGISEEALMSWGWRVPFVASVVLILIGQFIRMRLSESPAFEEIQKKKEVVKAPAVEMLRTQRRTLYVTIGMKMLQNAVFYLYSVFMLSYIVGTLKMDRSIGLEAILISSVIGFITLPAWSYLSDLIGRKKVYMFGTVASTLFIVPFFWMMETGSVLWVTIAVVIGLNILHDAMYGPQAVYFSELFGTKIRLSGASIGYAIGAVLSGGLAPIIATWLLQVNDGETWGISLYIMGLGLISIIATAFARETWKDALNETQGQ